MRQQLRHQACIALAATVVFFTNLGATRLWDMDEALHAACAREMFQRGDWVVPCFNGNWFFDKPPLMFWCMISGFECFGVTEFAARFWSALFGIGTALLTYHLGRLLFRAEVGLWAGLITASTIIFTVSARAATVDSALVFLTTAAILAFVAGGMRKWAAAETHGSAIEGSSSAVPAYLPNSWRTFALVYAFLGVAVLAKGPVGVVLPVAMLGMFLAIMNHRQSRESQPAFDAGEISPATSHFGKAAAWLKAMLRPLGPRNLCRSAWQLRPLTAILVILAVALPWYIMVGLRTDGQWLKEFFFKHNLQRALHPFEAHSGPIYYYLFAILVGFFPWSVFFGPSFANIVRRMRGDHAWKDGYILIACWIGVFVVFWSLITTKLPHYVLPAYPALALLTACFVDRWLTEPDSLTRWWLRNAWISTILVGVGMMIALPFVAARYLPGEGWLGLVGLVPLIGGAACWWWTAHERHRRAAIGFAVTSVAFLTAMFGFAVLRVDRYQNAGDLLAAIERDSPNPPDLISYRFQRESFVYYAGRAIPHCQDGARLGELIAQSQRPYIITDDRHVAEIDRDFQGRFSVLVRLPKFLKKGEVVVLAPHAVQAPACEAASLQPNAKR